MKVKIYKCDHCGKELDEAFDYTEIEIDDFEFPIYETTDLCRDCYKKLSNHIGEFCNKKVKKI